MKNEEFLLIIDGSSLLTTQFFGNLPKEIMFAKTTEEKEKYFPKIMQTSNGVYTNAVYGFLRVLLKIIKEQKPAYLAVTWDVSRNTFRRELYPDYKGNRGETLAPLKSQFLLCQQVLKSMGVVQFMDERYEADDFSGSLCTKFENQVPVRIMTKDNDYLQLVTEKTNLWLIHSTAKKTDELYEKYEMDKKSLNVPDRTFLYTPELIEKEFGIEPSSVPSLKGIQGDSSDNIKGVPGVGEATATALIKEYKTVENLYAAIRNLNDKEKKQVSEYWKKLGIKRTPMNALLKTSDTELVGEKAAFLSEKLATIKKDINLPVTLESLKVNINEQAAQKEFDGLEFKSLKISSFLKEEPKVSEDGFVAINDSPFSEEEEEESKEIKKVNNLEQIDEIVKRIIFVTNGDEFAAVQKELNEEEETIAFCVREENGQPVSVCLYDTKQRCYVFEIDEKVTIKEINRLIEKLKGKDVTFVCFDLKRQLPYLTFTAEDDVFDLKLAAYLLSPNENAYEYDEVAGRYASVTLLPLSKLLSKKTYESLKTFEPEEYKKAAAYEAVAAGELYLELLQKLNKEGMLCLFETIEMPLVYTLFDMEQRGILVDKAALLEYGKNLKEGIKRLEQEIYEAVGEEFNINSPKQLGEILFEKLKLPNGKKTKTGYSTSAEVLEKLKIEDPVIEKILDYRQLTKLSSTYAEGLLSYIKEDGRIHSTFNQTITATGRLSSTDPNLQNIPIRMELGRQIRKVFVPEDGFVFLDADYSQIELRLLAHMSGDEKLIDAFIHGLDIHRLTASQVFHTPFEEVTKTQRSNAKAVNFGIVYGISAFSLSEDIACSRAEAQEYINQYFAGYPKVKGFLDGLIEQGKETGYVKTVYDRKRPVPDLVNNNFFKRSQEERIAMNSPIQGTAADIMKIAMIKVNDALKERNLKSRLLLQIHDELVVETYKPEIELVKELIQTNMEQAADLKVPLVAEVTMGTNWYEAK